MGDAGVDKLVEVVRQNLRRETDGDAVRPLGQQQRELDGQRHRLLVAAVVGTHPLGGLLVENHVEGELRQTRLDVTACGGLVTREDVAPVALAVYQQLFLPQLHESVLDGSVAVGMVLHGLPDDVGHLVVAAVVDGLHGVENTPLHGLQTVLDMGHGAFEDDIRCVIEEPVLVHACELAHPALLLRQTVVLAAPGRGGRRFGIVRIGCAGGCFGSPVADGSGRRGLPVELLFGMDSIFILRHQFWIMNCEL